jgi:hypothetical protein
MTTITIELPIPPAVLHPNARTCRQAKWGSTKRYRNSAYLRTLEALNGAAAPKWKSATLHATWYFRTAARRDLDNLGAWLKAGHDGIADAGIVENDRDFIPLPPTVNTGDARPRIIITIEAKQ